MRSILRSLDEIQPSDASYVGGKAFHCASLKQASFPVPVIPEASVKRAVHDGSAVVTTIILKDGDRISLDATSGVVQML
jgi:hypothetical protein